MLYPYAAYAAVIPACAPASSAALRDFLTPPRPRERRGTPVEPLGRPLFPDPLLLVGVTKMRDDYPANQILNYKYRYETSFSSSTRKFI